MQQERITPVTAVDPSLAPERGKPTIPMSRRILLLGIILVPVVCILAEYGEIVRLVELVTTSLMLLVTSLLLVFLALNALLKRWLPKYRFSQGELLYLFVMLTVAGNVAGIGMMQFLVPLLSHMFYFATPENKWGQFLPYLPAWMSPQGEAVIKGFWRGQGTFFTAANIQGWLVPFVVWTLFVFAFISFMLCMNLLLRRQWIERERLAFPIVYFPLELTKEGGSLFRDKLLWLGFLIPVVLESLASLNYLYPSVPYLPIKPSPELNLGRFFGAIPSNPFANVTLAFYPLALGIAYFVQLEVLFSAWFFYWFARFEELVCVLLGFRGPEASARMYEMPYLNQQSLGAFVALGIVALWLARKYIAEFVMQAIKGRKGQQQEDVLSPRLIIVGLLVTGGFLLVFSVIAGISIPIVVLFFAIYFLTVLGFTRIRAEAGLPWTFGPNHPPHIFMAWGVGPVHIPPRSLTVLNYYTWFDWDWRGTTMPHQMEGLKIASSANLRSRDMAKGILLASAIAIVAAFITLLALYYRFGGESGNVDNYRAQWGGRPTTLLRTWAESGANTNWGELAGGAVGSGMVLLLAWLRSRWLWWPFHPVGYALSGTFTPEWLWSPLCFVWVVKSLILRYGGMRLYRRGIPFAIGLILGDYAITAGWALAGVIIGRNMYSTFPT